MLKCLQLNDVCLWLGGRGISDPVSLAGYLFTYSVRATEHLVRSIVSFETLNWILNLIMFLLISSLIVNS